MRRLLLVCVCFAAVACSRVEVAPSTTIPFDPEIRQVAEDLCPALLEWQRTVAVTMNTMSKATVDQADPGVREREYETAFGRARRINADLEQTVLGLSRGPYVDDLVVEVLDGLGLARRIIDDREQWTVDLHATGSPSYRDVVPAIFSDFEKVVEVVKPEMSHYRNPVLVNSFATVEDCRYGVKDVPREDPYFRTGDPAG